MNLRAKLSVFLLALAVRTVFLVQWMKTPFFLSPQTDAKIHQLWALEILQNGIWRDTAFYQSPFYPYLMALLYKIFGVHPLLMPLVQILVDSATCVMIYAIAKKMFGPGEGLAAGIIAALYSPFVFFSTPLLKEVWLLFFLAVLVRVVLETNQAGKPWPFGICGLALGLCALSRGQMLLFAPALCVYWLLAQKIRVIKPYLLFALGFLAVLLPVTLHNYIVSKDFVLINYTSGFSFFIGNNPQAEVWTRHPLGISSSPLTEERQVREMAEELSGRKLKPSEVSAFWHRQSAKYIFTQPLDWLKLTLRKFIFFWNRVDIPDNYCLAFFTSHFQTILDLPLFTYGVVAALGVTGMVLCWGLRTRINFIIGLGVLYMISVVPCVVSTRYRLPMAFFLILFSGAAIFRVWEKARWRRLLIAVPFWLFLLLPPPFDPALLDIRGKAQLVMIYYDGGQFEKSIRTLENLLDRSDVIPAPALYLRGALAGEKMKAFDRAERIYQQGIKAHPDNFLLRMEYGVFLYHQNRPAESARQFVHAHTRNPDSFAACKYLAIVFWQQKKYDKAVAYAGKALQMNPQDAKLQKMLRFSPPPPAF